MSKKTALNSVVLLALDAAGAHAGHLGEDPSTYFTFTNGGPSINSGLSMPTGSWWSMLAVDYNSDYVPDADVYISMRGTVAAAPENDAYTAPDGFGYLHFGIINTVTPGAGGSFQNTGNMITRDWSFLGVNATEFTTSPLTVSAGCAVTSTACTVDMSGWRIIWNGITSINVGAGAPAVLAASDGIWGNGNDTLDYSAIVQADDPSGFGLVQYKVHLVGSYTPVPLPSAIWLFAVGLAGLASTIMRKPLAS